MKPILLPLLRSAAPTLVAITSIASAQHDPFLTEIGEGPAPVPCVTLFSDPFFEGESITISAGERWDDFNHMRFPNGKKANNRVSSILIEGHAEVTLFDYREFEGESITLRESAPRLDRVPQGRWGDWDNEISSIIVHDDSPYVVEEFGGNRRPHVTTNVRIPTVHIPSAHRPHVGHSPNGSYDELVRDLVNDNHVTHLAITGETIRVLERAYQDVLGRGLDNSGRTTYARVLQDRGWSESRLRKELRNSPEYRDVVVPRTIKTAYREILGREADSAGLRFYSGRMISSSWPESRIRDALKKSPEYANRTRISPPRKEPTIRPPNIPRKTYTAPKPDRPKATYASVTLDRPKVAAPVKTSNRPKTTFVVSKPDRPKVSTPRPQPPKKEKELPAKRPPPKLN